jgi:hypothetical protein
MNRRFAAFSVFAALALGFMLVRMDGAEAKGDYANEFLTAYPAAGSLATCSTCHTSAPSLNPYGADLAATGRDYAGIGSLDSDGDGVSNNDEIAALTNPGDASDTPATTTTTVATTPSTTTPTVPPTTTPTTPSTTTSSTPSTTTPTIPSTATPTAPTVSDAVEFPMVIDAGDAGTVVLDLVEGKLVGTVQPNDGWSFKVENEDDEFEVKFRNGESEVEVEAASEDGK